MSVASPQEVKVKDYDEQGEGECGRSKLRIERIISISTNWCLLTLFAISSTFLMVRVGLDVDWEGGESGQDHGEGGEE